MLIESGTLECISSLQKYSWLQALQKRIVLHTDDDVTTEAVWNDLMSWCSTKSVNFKEIQFDGIVENIFLLFLSCIYIWSETICVWMKFWNLKAEQKQEFRFIVQELSVSICTWTVHTRTISFYPMLDLGYEIKYLCFNNIHWY